jgi:hypothetical protein
MKTSRLLSIVLGMTAACALRAADTKPAPRTEVVFDHPENFSDVQDSSNPTDRGRDSILSSIRDFVVARADHALPAGYSLVITFTDIHLAGEYEPWRSGQYNDVRIVKDIYPPSFKFTYSITDGSGRVVKQGSESIRDLDFQTRLALDTSDPLRYEKGILGEWVTFNVDGLKKR